VIYAIRAGKAVIVVAMISGLYLLNYYSFVPYHLSWRSPEAPAAENSASPIGTCDGSAGRQTR